MSPSRSSSVNSDNSELVSSCCVADLLLVVWAEVRPDLEGIVEGGGGDGEGDDRGSEEAIDFGMLKAGGPVFTPYVSLRRQSVQSCDPFHRVTRL